MIVSPTVFSGSRQAVDWLERARALGVDGACLPRHVAIIMDGNGRWAKRHHRPRELGHRRGVEALRRTVRAASGLGLEALTLYSFSSENWKRPPGEVSALMGLLRHFIMSDLEDLKAHGVHVRVIGERQGLAPDIADLLVKAEQETAANTRFTLVIAFNYGARDEITRAVRSVCRDVAEGRLAPEAVNEALIAGRLDTHGLPDPDLLIRTSGEQRISNFLAWQCAYTEFVFQDTLWPDYTGDDLLEAIRVFQGRERRYGGRPAAESGCLDTECHDADCHDTGATRDHLAVHAGGGS